MNKKGYKLKGKIGFCQNTYLGIRDKYGYSLGGHYVYIRKVNVKNNTCDVNIVTSLEEQLGDKSIITKSKLARVRSGDLYPIPKSDANLSRWSAFNLNGNVKNVPLDKIVNVGKIKIKDRHKFFVGKFTKSNKKSP